MVFAAWKKAGLLPHQVCIWAQEPRRVLSRCDYCWDYEPLLTAGSRADGPARAPAAGRSPAVWSVGSAIEDGQGGLHPTQKPVELIRRPIEYHTRVGRDHLRAL